MKHKYILENILTRFVKNLEDHGKDWVKPWLGSSNLQPPINATTGYHYAGINWFNLIAPQMPEDLLAIVGQLSINGKRLVVPLLYQKEMVGML